MPNHAWQDVDPATFEPDVDEVFVIGTSGRVLRHAMQVWREQPELLDGLLDDITEPEDLIDYSTPQHASYLISGSPAQEMNWEPVNGFSGQYGYGGPTMHPSEMFAGTMARRIIEMTREEEQPQVFVITTAYDGELFDKADAFEEGTAEHSATVDEYYEHPTGWVLLRHMDDLEVAAWQMVQSMPRRMAEKAGAPTNPAN